MFKLFVQTFPVSYTTTMKLTFATDGETPAAEILATEGDTAWTQD